MDTETIPTELKSDLLRGGRAIAEYTGEPERRVYHWLENGHIPGFKIGNIWYTRKSALHRLFGGEAA